MFTWKASGGWWVDDRWTWWVCSLCMFALLILLGAATHLYTLRAVRLDDTIR